MRTLSPRGEKGGQRHHGEQQQQEGVGNFPETAHAVAVGSLTEKG